ISEADIRSSPDRLALGRRKCDLLQERKRHRENDRAASKAAAISTTNHHLARFRLDRAHHRSESKRDSTLAAVRRQDIDQGTITTDDSRLRTPLATQPFLAKGEDACPFGLGGVVAFNHALDRVAKPVVFDAAEMSVQEFGDRHVPRQRLQRRAKLEGMELLRLPGRERSVLEPPSSPLDRLLRETRLTQQRMGNRRLAVDEFRAAFRGVADLGSWQRTNAAAAPLARLKDGDALACGCKLARGHQAGSPCPNDDDHRLSPFSILYRNST